MKPNYFSEQDILFFRDSIEKMNKFHQIEILHILVKNHLQRYLNENKYGVYVNFSEIASQPCNQPVILELKKYIEYIQTQEQNLEKDEKQKEVIKKTYFNKSYK